MASVDPRGTPAPRGREWRKTIYRRIGTLTSRDIAGAVDAIEEWPYVDPDRTAIWGWSGGGSQTLNSLFRYPEVFETGMAVAPVPDIRLYDTIYQERYMGLPQDNPEDYRAELADHVRRPARRATSWSSTAPATTTSTSRAPSGWSTRWSRRTSRSR